MPVNVVLGQGTYAGSNARLRDVIIIQPSKNNMLTRLIFSPLLISQSNLNFQSLLQFSAMQFILLWFAIQNRLVPNLGD